MKKFTNLKRTVVFIISAIFFFSIHSCSLLDDDEILGPKGKARYENPPWLGGSSIDTLENNPDYSIFIELMDKAGFRETIKKQLFTLFVPNNESFKSYFQSLGKSGVSDLTEDEAQQIFSLHLLENARTRFQLIYEYKFSELQGPNGEYASLFFRKQTNSYSLPKLQYVKYYKTFLDKELLVISKTKRVPLFSTDFIEDFGGIGSDYVFIYRNSTYSNNLNWHNAAITDAEVRTSSGFIYFLDQMLPPMPNIDEYLYENQDRFGVYYDLAQRFASYSFAKYRTEDQAKLYYKNYTGMHNIADEYGPIHPNNNETQSMRHMFTAFVPSNAIMQEYLNTRFGSFENIDSIPQVTLNFIVQSQIVGVMGLISKMEKFMRSTYGDEMIISRDDIKDAFMCSNGVVYETSKFYEPNVFTCVPGKLFFESNYTTFLQALNAYGQIATLSNPTNDVTLFAVNNELMEKANYRYDDVNNRLLYRGTDNIWRRITDESMVVNFLLDHMYSGVVEDLTGEGFLRMMSGNYLHYNNNIIEGGKNVLLGESPTVLLKTVNEKNGVLYELNSAIETNYTFGEMLVDNDDFSEFTDLLIKTNYLIPDYVDPISEDTIAKLSFIANLNTWTAFIPNNQAMKDAYSAGLDTTDVATNADLKMFLMYHFVRDNTIFDDGIVVGDVYSNLMVNDPIYGNIYLKMNIENSLKNLSVTDLSGNKVNVNHSNANKLVKNGVVHEISTVLNYNN